MKRYTIGKIALFLFGLSLLLGLPSLRQGVQAQGTTHGVTLTWTTGANDVAFNVYRGTVSGGPYTSIATGVSVTTYFDTTGTGGTKYFYVVTGTAPGQIESAYSNEASATFLVQVGAPGGLAAVAK